MRSLSRAALLLVLPALTACGEASHPTNLTAPDAPALARPGGGGSGDTSVRTAFYFPLAATGLAIASDSVAAYTQTYLGGASYSRYKDAECGVTSQLQGTGDATMQTNNPHAKPKGCGVYPRKLWLNYPDGFREKIEIFMNVHQLHLEGTSHIPVGATVKRAMGINPTQTTRCDALRFTAERSGEHIGADSVLVTRVDARTWRVRSQADTIVNDQVVHRDRARCTTSGQLYRMPFELFVEADRNLSL